MKHFLTAGLSSFLLIFGVSLTAYAEDNVLKPHVDTRDGWKPKTINLSWTGNGVKKDMRGVMQKAEGIYSGNEGTTGNVAFTCYAGSFSANIALEPVNLEVLFLGTPDSRRRKIKRADIKIDGESIKSSDWIYMPAMKVYRARKKSTAAKLYNAVIRKSEVLVKSGRSNYVALQLPEQDRAFKNFGSQCGMGLHAVKS